MRTKTTLRVLIGSAAFLAPLALTASAQASGFGTARFGGEHGHPTTDNPTAIYYNPAGLAEDTPGMEKKDWRLKFFVDGNLALRWAGWSHAASRPNPTCTSCARPTTRRARTAASRRSSTSPPRR